MKTDELIKVLEEEHDFVGKPAGWNYCKICKKYKTNMLGHPDTVGRECE